jgi:hypothetical protein
MVDAIGLACDVLKSLQPRAIKRVLTVAARTEGHVYLPLAELPGRASGGSNREMPVGDRADPRSRSAPASLSSGRKPIG